MLSGTCIQLKPFNFYSLEEFDYQQLISKNKNFVGSFFNKQTKLQFVIKEIPFKEKSIRILKKILKMRSCNIVNILGASTLHNKTQNAQSSRIKAEKKVEKNEQKYKDSTSMLIFMQKFQMNLYQYVLDRKKKNQPFSRLQISNFLSHMLSTLQKLQRQGLSHRDIKPDNILCHKGMFYLCDFEDMIEYSQNEKCNIDLTTVQYSSPEFLKQLRKPKDKLFDPFKLDLYSLGLTFLFMCSMGKFSRQERSNYIYQSSELSHADFIKDQRRKWIKNNSQYKSFNEILKMMLEEDEYKRDDFITIQIKQKQKYNELDPSYSDYNFSEDNSAKTKSSSKLLDKKAKKILRAKKDKQLKEKQLKVYGSICTFLVIFFVILCLL